MDQVWERVGSFLGLTERAEVEAWVLREAGFGWDAEGNLTATPTPAAGVAGGGGEEAAAGAVGGGAVVVGAMPDYFCMTKTALDREMSRFGLKSAGKQQMAEKLATIWIQTHPHHAPAEEETTAAGAVSAAAVSPPRKRPAAAAGVAEGSSSSEERVGAALRANPEVWGRLLIMESMELDELARVVRNAEPKLPRTAVVRALDDQGVSYHTTAARRG